MQEIIREYLCAQTDLHAAGRLGQTLGGDMNDEGQNWFYGLRQFVADCRVKRPIVDREELSAEQEMQCRIIGGSLISWLNRHGPLLLEERAVLAAIENWEKDPFVVFTSEQSGLVAAREILVENPDTIASLYPQEFADWRKPHPDPGYRWHVHTWSFFIPIDPDTAKKAKKYPISPGESYWLHKEGTMCGPLFGRGGDHLWKWNGQAPELLEEGINRWVS